MNNLINNKLFYKFNDMLIAETELDIDSPVRLKEFFETYYILHELVDNNMQKTIDNSSKQKYVVI